MCALSPNTNRPLPASLPPTTLPTDIRGLLGAAGETRGKRANSRGHKRCAEAWEGLFLLYTVSTVRQLSLHMVGPDDIGQELGLKGQAGFGTAERRREGSLGRCARGGRHHMQERPRGWNRGSGHIIQIAPTILSNSPCDTNPALSLQPTRQTYNQRPVPASMETHPAHPLLSTPKPR